MDDWVLSTFNIPSVTNELGTEDQYTDAWTVQSVSTGYQLCNENLQWLEHTYHKIGPQLKLNGGSFKNLAQNAPKEQQMVGISSNDTSTIPDKEEQNLMQLDLILTNQGLSSLAEGGYNLQLNNDNMKVVSFAQNEINAKGSDK